jgi:hypothetical protein
LNQKRARKIHRFQTEFEEIAKHDLVVTELELSVCSLPSTRQAILAASDVESQNVDRDMNGHTDQMDRDIALLAH